MSSNKNSKARRAAAITAVVSGLQKNWSTQTALALGGASYAPTDLIKLLEADIAAGQAATSAKADLTAAAKAERDSRQKVDPLLRFIKAMVIGQLGDSENAASKLADYGYTPRKITVPSAAVKAEAVIKMRATRAARGTMGPKQRAKVVGVVPAAPPTGSTAAAGPTAQAVTPPAQVKPAS